MMWDQLLYTLLLESLISPQEGLFSNINSRQIKRISSVTGGFKTLYSFSPHKRKSREKW